MLHAQLPEHIDRNDIVLLLLAYFPELASDDLTSKTRILIFTQHSVTADENADMAPFQSSSLTELSQPILCAGGSPPSSR